MDFLQLIFSIGLICSIALLPFSFFCARESHWGGGAAAVGPPAHQPVAPDRLSGIRRWMVRTVKRKEAPDGEADCFLSS